MVRGLPKTLRDNLCLDRELEYPPCGKGTTHLQTHMPSLGFKPRPYGAAVSITNHYNGWTSPTNLTELWAALANIWQVISVERFRKPVESMSRRVAAIIKIRGGPYRYRQLLDIMIVQLRNEKVSNHGSIPITIDCNVVAFIVFEEGFNQPIKRTKQSVFLDVTVFRHTLVD
ncbi:hypothetical protein TNCV_4278991 [Trichonephila clavipes]|nr:hypothetical protein TNCV_4278991 [Trichonephila clavipes]